MIPEHLVPAFSFIGAFTVVTTVFSLLGVFYKTMLRGGKNLKKNYGEWAVVTGGTDGIGKAMAFELARKGQSVLLVARSKEKLSAVQAELSAKYPNVQVATEVVDFSKFGAGDAARMADVLGKLEVGVLVNNVGISYAFPQWFNELTDDEVATIMKINIDSVVWMTRAVLPQMLARKKGAVVNMSSASARPPNPLLAVYSSTKGFVENFTKSLAVEYSSKGVHFQCQSPLWVATQITFPNSKVPVDKRATIGTPTAKNYARYAVARIGYDTMTSPYWAHEVFMWWQARMPESFLGNLVLKIHKGARFHKKNVALMEEKLAKKRL